MYILDLIKVPGCYSKRSRFKFESSYWNFGFPSDMCLKLNKLKMHWFFHKLTLMRRRV